MVSRSQRLVPAIAAVALFVAACSGTPAATPTVSTQPTTAATTAAASAASPTAAAAMTPAAAATVVSGSPTVAATTAAATPTTQVATTTAAPATTTPATPQATTSASTATPATSAASTDARVTYTVMSGTTADFKVREQLVGHDLPSDAIGKTSAVTGKIVLGADGKVDSTQSKFTVNLTTLKSDQPRRDGFIQRSTLDTAQYPTATFVPSSVTGLPSPLPASGKVTFQLVGDLTVHGVSHPMTWNVTATVNGNDISGQASTPFTFADFGMTPPKAGPVLSVNNNGTLELAFTLSKGA